MSRVEPLEREDALRAIERALAAARGGRGRLVLVEAPAGLGKTLLLDRAAVAAREAGLSPLAAAGGEAERDFPFGVTVALLGPAVAAAGADARAALLSGAAELAAPIVAGRVPPRPAAGEADTLFALLHALHHLTVHLADRAPLALLVDDAHWADEPSLRHLLYLARRLDDLPIALVVALRPADAAGDGVLAQLRAEEADVIRLAPLSEPAAATLARSVYPDADAAFCAACATATGGNPLLLRELLRTLRDEGAPPIADAVRDVAAHHVARSVLLRLSRLPEAASRLAVAVAVLGEHARLEEAAALAGLDLDAAASAAGLLQRADVLAAGGAPAFAHPILRAAVLDDLPEPERRRAHANAAAVLRATGASRDRVAAQLLRSSPVGAPWAVDELRAAAADAAARGAPATAERILRRALEEPGAPAGVRLELGRCLTETAPYAAPGELDRAAAELASAGERAQARLLLGRALLNAGRHAEGVQALREALAVATDEEMRRQIGAALLTAATVVPELVPETGDLRAVLVGGRDEPLGAERGLLVMAAVQRVFALEPHGDALALARRAWGDGRLIADRGLDAIAFSGASAVLTWCDDLGAAIGVADAVIGAARRLGSLHAFASASYCRATPALWSGRVAEAIADAEAAVAGADAGAALWLVPAGALLAWARLEAGDRDGGRAAVAAAERSLDGLAPHFAAYLLHARGRLRAADGDHDGALADQLEAGRGLQTPNPAVLPWRSAAARAALHAGRPEQAAQLAAEELELARRFGAPRAVGIAHATLGLVTQDAEALAAAVEVLERSPARLELARARLDLGRVLRRAGRRAEAREALRAALDAGEQAGATAIAADARDELRVAGGRPRRARLSGADALTPAERRDALLAADGLTNRAIAETLFVTRKTVDFHLRGVYRKLGVSDRRLLGAALAAERDEPASVAAGGPPPQ